MEATECPFEVLGLQPTASLNDVKCAYRTLAKRYHPDKYNGPEAKTVFQKLNKAYHVLANQLCDDSDNRMCDKDDNSQSNGDEGNDATLLTNVPIIMRENSFSVTIDILDMLFLVFVEECERHHGVTPIDRGQHGLQFRFSYISPNDNEQYGTLSLTLYPTTSRLLVQGTSYLLWVNEHLPIIHREAEVKYLADVTKWRALALRRGIGVRRESRYKRDGHSRTNDNREAVEVSVITHQISVSPLEHPALPAGSTTDLASTPAADTCLVSEPDTDPKSDAVALLQPVRTASNSNSDDEKVPHPAPSEQYLSPKTQSITTPQRVCHDEVQGPGSDSETSDTPTHPQAVDDCAVRSGSPPATLEQSERGTKTRGASKLKGDSKRHQQSTSKTCRTKTANCKGKKSPPVDGTRGSQPIVPCKSDCHANRKQAKDMIRCSLCMSWYHTICVGEDTKYIGVWTCGDCRNIPAHIVTMKEQIADLVLSLARFQETEGSQKEEINRLKSENNRLHQKVSNLEQNNKELTKLIETMSDITPDVPTPTDTNVTVICPTVPTRNRFDVLAQDQSTDVSSVPLQANRPSYVRRQSAPNAHQPKRPPRRDNNTHPVSVTVIGSSIVRGVSPCLQQSKDYNAVGFVYPGMTAKYINGRLKDIPESDVTVITAGSNNIEKQPLKECAEEVRQVIDNISRKRRGNTVIMCQIPHRFDKPYLNNKIDGVNKLMADEISKYSNVHLLTHEVVARDFKKDGLHFNNRGIAKFALEIRRVIRKVGFSE